MSQSRFTRELITKKLSSEFGIAYSVVYKKIDKILEILSNEMIKNDITINNIGSFKINKKNERIGRNPKTKEEHLIKSRKVISFKKSNKLVL